MYNSIDNNFCKIFKENDNPTFQTYNISKLFNYFNKISLKLATTIYFKNFICLLFGINDFLIIPDFPNLEVIDEKSKLEILKIIMLYEKIGIKMIHIKGKKVLLYNPKCDKKLLHKYLYYNFIFNGEINLNLNETEQTLLKENGWGFLRINDTFNFYLRRHVMDQKFWEDVASGKKNISIENLEKIVESEFKKRCKEDKNYLTEMKKIFNIEMNYLEKKINYKPNTKEYKMITKFIKDNTKPFKFPLKEYFGERNPISYQCFKSLLDEFKKSITKEDLKSICYRCKT
jgi:hypothetical protein